MNFAVGATGTLNIHGLASGPLSLLLAVFLTASGAPESAAGATFPNSAAMFPEAWNNDLLYVRDLTGVLVYSPPRGRLIGLGVDIRIKRQSPI